MKGKLYVLLLAGALGIGSASSALAAPTSPGACHMMDANSHGIAGMFGSADQGLGNMIDVVSAALGAGCTP
jgi:hypothetical protein